MTNNSPDSPTLSNLSRRFWIGRSVVSVVLLTGMAAFGPVSSSANGVPVATGAQTGLGAAKAGVKPEKSIVVTINMGPVKYEPQVITVPAGKPITLRFVNKATIDHEALIGDLKVQEAHEKMMNSMPGMHHGDLKGFVEVAAGKTKDLKWTFAKAGVTYIGCHLPAHYKGGMKLKVLVQSSTGIA